MHEPQSRLRPIPNWEDQGCFACGAANPSGLQMKFFSDGERVFAFPEVPTRMAGWDRVVHGGIISTILDEIMGWAAIHLFKQLGVTGTMTIAFKKPLFVGERLTAVGSALAPPSGRSVQMQGQLYNAKEQLCAEATGVFKLIPPKTAVRMGIVSEAYLKIFAPILEFDYHG
ncbi:MAG: PaaI family thioesterase [Desulfosarcinaceae bacterium]|nr:PaaI family thioesterase [Desulfosarcinaceae bacterium]